MSNTPSSRTGKNVPSSTASPFTPRTTRSVTRAQRAAQSTASQIPSSPVAALQSRRKAKGKQKRVPAESESEPELPSPLQSNPTSTAGRSKTNGRQPAVSWMNNVDWPLDPETGELLVPGEGDLHDWMREVGWAPNRVRSFEVLTMEERRTLVDWQHRRFPVEPDVEIVDQNLVFVDAPEFNLAGYWASKIVRLAMVWGSKSFHFAMFWISKPLYYLWGCFSDIFAVNTWSLGFILFVWYFFFSLPLTYALAIFFKRWQAHVVDKNPYRFAGVGGQANAYIWKGLVPLMFAVVNIGLLFWCRKALIEWRKKWNLEQELKYLIAEKNHIEFLLRQAQESRFNLVYSAYDEFERDTETGRVDWEKRGVKLRFLFLGLLIGLFLGVCMMALKGETFDISEERLSLLEAIKKPLTGSLAHLNEPKIAHPNEPARAQLDEEYPIIPREKFEGTHLEWTAYCHQIMKKRHPDAPRQNPWCETGHGRAPAWKPTRRDVLRAENEAAEAAQADKQAAKAAQADKLEAEEAKAAVEMKTSKETLAVDKEVNEKLANDMLANHALEKAQGMKMVDDKILEYKMLEDEKSNMENAGREKEELPGQPYYGNIHKTVVGKFLPIVKRMVKSDLSEANER